MKVNKLRHGDRASALWGSSTRGGDSRGSALWGKGGRRAGATLISAAFAAVFLSFGASLPASASNGNSGSTSTFIPAALLSQAQADPSSSYAVIIQGDGSDDADHLAHKIAAWASQGDSKGSNAALAAQNADQIVREQVTNEFSSINGVAVTLTGRQLTQVYAHGNDGLLAITPDVPVQSSGVVQWSSNQMWPSVSGAASNWNTDQNAAVATNMPTIAVVDSGVQSRADFGSRLLASVNLSTLTNNSAGDGRGHGTFVAGLAAGASDGYAGAAPGANLISVDVLDDTGMGMTSDIINACQWILDHKAQYKIKIANFSLNSSITAPFWVDPLDRAVEKLWFNGVTVVTAAGNYGSASGASGVLFSPANDPFVITVGAADLAGTWTTNDDFIAPWSAWGSTIDGFAKPELAAPGRYMIGPTPSTSTIVAERPASVVAPGYIQLSGTSFAAPVVSGIAAQIIARHPGFTPDQVKGALMLTSRPIGGGVAGGVGDVNANKAVSIDSPPNPNAGLDQFVTTSLWGGSPVFDAASWNSAALADASWNSVSWNSASWNSASWNSASWNSVSWNSASWNSVSWNSASWNSVSWNSVSWNSVSWNSTSVTQ
jgi:serine protease AprX